MKSVRPATPIPDCYDNENSNDSLEDLSSYQQLSYDEAVEELGIFTIQEARVSMYTTTNNTIFGESDDSADLFAESDSEICNSVSKSSSSASEISDQVNIENEIKDTLQEEKPGTSIYSCIYSCLFGRTKTAIIPK